MAKIQIKLACKKTKEDKEKSEFSTPNRGIYRQPKASIPVYFVLQQHDTGWWSKTGSEVSTIDDFERVKKNFSPRVGLGLVLKTPETENIRKFDSPDPVYPEEVLSNKRTQASNRKAWTGVKDSNGVEIKIGDQVDIFQTGQTGIVNAINPNNNSVSVSFYDKNRKKTQSVFSCEELEVFQGTQNVYGSKRQAVSG